MGMSFLIGITLFAFFSWIQILAMAQALYLIFLGIVSISIIFMGLIKSVEINTFMTTSLYYLPTLPLQYTSEISWVSHPYPTSFQVWFRPTKHYIFLPPRYIIDCLHYFHIHLFHLFAYPRYRTRQLCYKCK